MDTIKIRKGSTQLIAHRGVSGLELENTCAAFVAAGNRSYFGIETDVHVTADGSYIIIHDDTTKRVGMEAVMVEQSTFAALRSIQLKQKDGTIRCDLRLPSLEEYLSICKRYQKTAVLELKNPMENRAVKGIVEKCEEVLGLDHMIFIGYCFENLAYIRGLAPDVRIQQLVREPLTEDQIQSLEEQNFGLDAHHGILSPELIQRLHEKGIPVNCWTIDDPLRAEELISWGVDQLTTNILE